MRKILAGFLATTMICSMATMVSAATSPSFSITAQDLKVTPTMIPAGAVSGATAGSNTMSIKTVVSGVTLAIEDSSKQIGTIDIPLSAEYNTPVTVGVSGPGVVYNGSADVTVAGKAEIKALLVGQKFNNASIGGKLYNGEIVSVAGTDKVAVKLNGSAVTYTDVGVVLHEKTTLDYSKLKMESSGTNVVINSMSSVTAGGLAASGSDVITGTGADTSDVTSSGDFFKNLGIKDVIWCDGNGDPLAMVENGKGVDNEVNEDGGVQGAKTLYFMVNDSVEPTFADDNYWKLKITKGDNGKLIKNITDTTKIFKNTLYDGISGKAINDIDFTKRHRFIKVELNDIFTDDEYKVTLDMRISPTSRAETKFTNLDSGEMKIKDFSFWVKNLVKGADNDWKVGLNGLMLSPAENDWNNVTWYDEDGDLAHLKFFADSDSDKFYSKLSTKWNNEDYASYFNDQDAFIFDFTGSPALSATSRADLQIYNPFVDEDGNETIDPATAVIYQVIDGDPYLISDSFQYGEGENGDMAFLTRTRMLGTYIICEKEVPEAVTDEEVPDELAPDEIAPDGTTPDAKPDNGGKAPANTGKYL